jgi:Methyltransferase domain
MSRRGRGEHRPRLRGRALWWLVRRGADRTGHDLVARDYYSPLPDVERLRRRGWGAAGATPGVDLRIAEAVGLLEELRPWLEEFGPRVQLEAGFPLGNGAYGSVDAEILYALVRHNRPARVLELGSGASSHVIAAAQRANEAEGSGFEHRIFDPYPFQANPLGAVSGPIVAPVRAEDLDASEVTALRRDDILFVDTTHTVKTGGDVTRIVLDLVPLLAPGVLVHFHDIFLPHEYPSQWVLQERRAWAEQYLLQAFLAFNDNFEVVFPARAVVGAEPEAVAAAIPSFSPGVTPGAFWIRRVG